jgi:hypothetical protein
MGPGAAEPVDCERLRLESERWAGAVKRLREAPRQHDAEDAGGGFEVPPLPTARGQ